jgi:hypothetical protein
MEVSRRVWLEGAERRAAHLSSDAAEDCRSLFGGIVTDVVLRDCVDSRRLRLMLDEEKINNQAAEDCRRLTKSDGIFGPRLSCVITPLRSLTPLGSWQCTSQVER